MREVLAAALIRGSAVRSRSGPAEASTSPTYPSSRYPRGRPGWRCRRMVATAGSLSIGRGDAVGPRWLPLLLRAAPIVRS